MKIPHMIPNPEYLASPVGQYELAKGKENLARWGIPPEDFFPEDYGKKLQPEGAWILITLSVHVGKPLPDGGVENITVPHLSIWYALPGASTSTMPVGPINIAASKAMVQTPKGEVHIWPHEYTLVDLSRLLEFTEEDGFYIHFMHPDTQGFDEMKMFYLRSRGISKAAAQRILLPQLQDPHLCYFTLHEKYSEIFGDGCGAPVILNRRR